MSVSDLEQVCGIACRLSSHLLFKGELKRFFEDFHVKEVSLSGELATPSHLLSRSEVNEQMKQEKEGQINIEAQDWSSVDLTALADLLSSEEVGRLVAAFIQGESNFLLAEIADKQRRTQVHQLVKQNYPFMFTDTVENDSRKFVRVWTRNAYLSAQKQERASYAAAVNSGGGRKRKLEGESNVNAVRFADPWPTDRPEYLRFILHKENRDTNECLGLLARCTRKLQKSFGVAGLKDRRGVTSQFVTLYKVPALQLQRVILNGEWDARNVKVSDFTYVSEGLKPGMLTGNLFHVVVRGVEHLDRVEMAIGNLKAHGFLNYFGLQRFGTGIAKTHEVGAAMLNKDWELVARKVLGDKFPTSEEAAAAEIAKIRQLDRKTQNVLRTEMHILEWLVENASNFQVAINATIKQKSLYFHALQSFLFNRALTHRMQTHGNRIVVGDLVAISDRDELGVTLVNETNISDFTLTDVVLPLPGGSIPFYPQNGCDRTFFQTVLSEGLDLALETVEDQLPGTYRKIVVIPTGIEYQVIEGPDAAKIRLIESDIKQFLPVSDRQEPLEANFDGKPAIVLSCQLPASAYLTMAIREVALEISAHKSQAVEQPAEEDQ